MIFVGSGALLKYAVNETIRRGYKIDAVVSNDGGSLEFLKNSPINTKVLKDINTASNYFIDSISDNVIMSINNSQIFKQPILSIPDIRIYNIHNGYLPFYRGLPEVCILFAILKGEDRYGATLHSVDEGIDTGECYDTYSFDIKNLNFQQVMFRGINACQAVFNRNIDAIVYDSLIPVEKRPESGTLYSYKDIKTLKNFTKDSSYTRATKLGMYKLWFKRLNDNIDEVS